VNGARITSRPVARMAEVQARKMPVGIRHDMDQFFQFFLIKQKFNKNYFRPPAWHRGALAGISEFFRNSSRFASRIANSKKQPKVFYQGG
jgi:hypothetical protein